MKLNHSQQEAVRHKDGPMLVLAGPGSGKTAVIAERTLRLVQEYNINPMQILVISFTRASANEMKRRYLKLTGRTGTQVTFGTFHSTFFAMLKNAYGMTGDNIAGEDARMQLMRQIMQKYRVEYDDETEMISNLLGEISVVKNSCMQVEHFYSKYTGEETFRDIFRTYETSMRRAGKIDFDDMLVLTYELLSQRRDILLGWQKRFAYIQIDEFQDINKLQFDIVNLLAGERKNLFAVGDDDQSIYRFRGAKPEIMLNFETVYPGCRKIVLDTNYRCGTEIAATAERLIAHNEVRYEKRIRSGRKNTGKVKTLLFQNENAEAKYVIDDILEKKQDGCSLSDMAVLFRTNLQSRYFMEKLMEHGIDFRSRERIPSLYDHFIARDFIAYLSCAAGGRERKDFLRIMNRPNRYFSRDSLFESHVAFDVWRDYYLENNQAWMAERVEELEFDLKRIGSLNPYAGINYIRKGLGYDNFLKEYAEYRNLDEEQLIDTAEEIHQLSQGFADIDAWFLHIRQYEEKLKREQSERRQESDKEALNLLTLHGCKGLEFMHVYILDVNQGIMPYKKAALASELEEERRMFYVGMTRARDTLTLCSVRTKNNRELDISPFIEECGNDG